MTCSGCIKGGTPPSGTPLPGADPAGMSCSAHGTGNSATYGAVTLAKPDSSLLSNLSSPPTTPSYNTLTHRTRDRKIRCTAANTQQTASVSTPHTHTAQHTQPLFTGRPLPIHHCLVQTGQTYDRDTTALRQCPLTPLHNKYDRLAVPVSTQLAGPKCLHNVRKQQSTVYVGDKCTKVMEQHVVTQHYRCTPLDIVRTHLFDVRTVQHRSVAVPVCATTLQPTHLHLRHVTVRYGMHLPIHNTLFLFLHHMFAAHR